MSSIRDCYNDYIKALDVKRSRVISMGITLKSSYDYITTQLRAREAMFTQQGYDINYVVSISFLKELNSTVADNFSIVGHSDEVAKVRAYLKNRFRIYARYNRLQHMLSEIKASYIPFTTFSLILKTYNDRIIHSVLKGNTFPMGQLGSLSVTRKPRLFHLDESVGVITKNINWHESNKKRQELIDQGITPYDKNTAPDGVKWFIYHDEPYTYWYKWIRSKWIRNKKVIKFTPTNFINTPDRDHQTIIANAKTIDDIIKTDKLGNMNKLQTLVKYSPSIASTYTLIENIHGKD